LGRYALGSGGGVVIYLLLNALFPGEESFFANFPLWGVDSPYYSVFHFLRYSIFGLWVSAGAPWLFCRTGLAETQVSANSGSTV
jgi:hypothetical protein